MVNLTTRDWDMSGIVRYAQRVNLGPSIGDVLIAGAVIEITAPMSLFLPLGIAMVRVNVADAVVLTLPSAKLSPAGPGAQPVSAVMSQLVIADVGGFADTNPITINAAPGELIANVASIQIATKYAAVTLRPNISTGLWVAY